MLLASCTACAPSRNVIDAGFWLEPVTFQSSKLGGPVTPQDLETIEG
jgi:hypothetical protein